MAEGCECLSTEVKSYLEGALIHYIRDIQKDVALFAKAAQEYKDINPELSKHYLLLVESQNAYIEKIQAAKSVVKLLPACEPDKPEPPLQFQRDVLHEKITGIRDYPENIEETKTLHKRVIDATPEELRELYREITGGDPPAGWTS